MSTQFQGKISLIILSLLSLGLSSKNAYAQRTIENQMFLCQGMSSFPSQGQIFGSGLEFGRYHRQGQSTARVCLEKGRLQLDAMNTLDLWDIPLEVYYGRRISSSVDRRFNIYCNIGGGLVIESLDPFGKLPDYYEITAKQLGAAAASCLSIQTETFISNKLALTFEPVFRYYLGSEILTSSLSLRLSIRYLI